MGMLTKLQPVEIFRNANVKPSVCLFCLPVPGMVMHETEHFRLMRVNFPAETGHLMISSKLHFGSGGEVDSELFPELISYKSHITDWFRSHLKNIIFYEHGRAGGCLTNSINGEQCEHFHLNIIPVDICLHECLKQLYTGIPIDTYGQVKECFDRYGDYLYFENNNHEKVFYSVQNQNVPAHFLRSLICEKIGKPERADWQKHQVYQDFLESYQLTEPLESYLGGDRI